MLAPLPLGQIIQIPNMRIPTQGAQGLPFLLDFTSESALENDLSAAFWSGVFDFVQSVYIDNFLNPNDVTLTFPGGGPLGYTIVAKAGTQGWYPVTTSMGDGRFTAVSTVNAAAIVRLIFANVPMAYVVWGDTGGGGGSSSPFEVGTYNDYSGTIAVGGTSQLCIPANANRKKVFIQNPSSASEVLYINFTDPAGNTGNSFEILPGGTYAETGSALSVEAINITADTGGHAFIAKELI